MMNTTIQKSKEKMSKSFLWSWSLSFGGGFMLIGATVASYFSIFMTDTVGIPAGAASIIMFVATLWDAVNDPIMGTVADRTNTKFGRYRPYFLFFPVLFVLVSYLLFLNPKGITNGQKIAYIAVFYILFGMLTTVLTMPVMAVVPAQTLDDGERNKTVTLGAIFMSLSFTIAATFTTKFTEFTNGSYAPLMLVYGILTIIPFWILFKVSNEKYIIKTEKRPIKQDLKTIFKHKELFSVIIVWCMSSLGYGLMFSSSVYYIMYYIGRPDLIAMYMGIISMGALISMMVFMPIALKVFKSGHKALKVTQIITFVCYAILFVLGKNLTILFVVSFIATLATAMEQGLINILVNDTVDYIQLKDGVSLNGTIAAIKGFSQKCGTTVTNTGILAMLAVTGYIAGAIGQQPESALIGINILRFGVPAITCIIIVVCLNKYPIEKCYEEINEMKSKIR